MLAPRSSTIDSPRTVGQSAAMAGRSMPGMVLRWNFAIAIRAPVLPAEIATSASPRLTASMASHIELFQRPWRNAWLGLASIATATSVWMNLAAALQRRTGREQRLDRRAVAEQQEFDVRMAPLRQLRAGDDHRGPMVPPHGV